MAARQLYAWFIDTDAEKPASGFVNGQLIYCLDTDLLYIADSGAWRLFTPRLEGRTSDPASPVAGDMWLRTDL